VESPILKEPVVALMEVGFLKQGFVNVMATRSFQNNTAKHEQEMKERMAIYITQGRYTPDAVKSMVANPDRASKVSFC
jgi:hypothetical protein